MLVAGTETGGRLALVATVEVPGAEPPCHCHHGEDEVLYVVAGELAVYVGNRWVAAPAGTAVHVPRGVEHSFAVLGDTAQVLTILAPAGFEGFYRDERSGSPWASGTPTEIERLIARAARHGCDITGPHPGRPPSGKDMGVEEQRPASAQTPTSTHPHIAALQHDD